MPVPFEEFAQHEKCTHKCGKCGARFTHQIACGPALPARCGVGVFAVCLQCRPVLTEEEITALPPVMQESVRRIEKRFARIIARGGR